MNDLKPNSTHWKEKNKVTGQKRVWEQPYDVSTLPTSTDGRNSDLHRQKHRQTRPSTTSPPPSMPPSLPHPPRSEQFVPRMKRNLSLSSLVPRPTKSIGLSKMLNIISCRRPPNPTPCTERSTNQNPEHCTAT
jgi:hypothetical protein